ncbi:MAG: DUF4167 domain-containing protein, partial [Pseudomonadota bacterium]
LAENYLQHAEHYNRIIMTYREQQGPAPEQMNGHRGRSHDDEQHDDSAAEDRGEAGEATAGADGEAEPRLNGAANGHDQPDARAGWRDGDAAGDEEGAPQERERPRRSPRNASGESTRPRRSTRSRAPASRSAEREENGELNGQPDFLKRPVRRTRRTAAQDKDFEAQEPASGDAPRDDTTESA